MSLGAPKQGEVDVDPAMQADEATMQAFFNCYLRETDAHKVCETSVGGVEPGPDGLVHATLSEQGIDLLAPLSYRSPTGRHLFAFPVYYRCSGADVHPIDTATLASLVIKELTMTMEGEAVPDELLERVLRSKQAVEQFVAARAGDDESLYAERLSLREAEQALVFGHHLHPTPKSRQGIAEHNRETYAPELRGSFPLQYFGVDPALVVTESALDRSAAEWVREALRDDPDVSETFVAEHVESEDVLFPTHPWQAEYLLDQPHVEEQLGDGIEHLGAVGREFAPTASVRTLYSPEAPFMVKSSLGVAITNSVRKQTHVELRRGVAIAELLDTGFGDELAERFPDFDIVRDPAYLALDVGESESGLETILRANPFRGDAAENATPVVSLCQDAITGRSRLGRIVTSIARREGRDTDEVSADWFERYLERSVRPILWLYLVQGLGVEAHQQNAVLTLDDEGYPDEFHYRDNQGFFFPESRVDVAEQYLPDVGDRADTVLPDILTDIGLTYYVVLNNALGVVNALGCAGVADEHRLLEIMRAELERARDRYDHEASTALDQLLKSETVPCKANLLTRFRGMDELENDIENQSVYTNVDNPLVTKLDS